MFRAGFTGSEFLVGKFLESELPRKRVALKASCLESKLRVAWKASCLESELPRKRVASKASCLESEFLESEFLESKFLESKFLESKFLESKFFKNFNLLFV
jgi:hypothetical protein